jgi:signal peptidase II
LLISALIVFADRLTKTWVALHIRLGGAIPIIPRVLRITHWTNEGAAFSLFADSASPHLVRYAWSG